MFEFFIKKLFFFNFIKVHVNLNEKKKLTLNPPPLLYTVKPHWLGWGGAFFLTQKNTMGNHHTRAAASKKSVTPPTFHEKVPRHVIPKPAAKPLVWVEGMMNHTSLSQPEPAYCLDLTSRLLASKWEDAGFKSCPDDLLPMVSMAEVTYSLLYDMPTSSSETNNYVLLFRNTHFWSEEQNSFFEYAVQPWSKQNASRGGQKKLWVVAAFIDQEARKKADSLPGVALVHEMIIQRELSFHAWKEEGEPSVGRTIMHIQPLTPATRPCQQFLSPTRPICIINEHDSNGSLMVLVQSYANQTIWHKVSIDDADKALNDDDLGQWEVHVSQDRVKFDGGFPKRVISLPNQKGYLIHATSNLFHHNSLGTLHLVTHQKGVFCLPACIEKLNHEFGINDMVMYDDRVYVLSGTKILYWDLKTNGAGIFVQMNYMSESIAVLQRSPGKTVSVCVKSGSHLFEYDDRGHPIYFRLLGQNTFSSYGNPLAVDKRGVFWEVYMGQLSSSYLSVHQCPSYRIQDDFLAGQEDHVGPWANPALFQIVSQENGVVGLINSSKVRGFFKASLSPHMASS